jgi:hypothetical protein
VPVEEAATLKEASPPAEVLTLTGWEVMLTVATGVGTVGVVGVVVVPPVEDPVEPVPEGTDTEPDPPAVVPLPELPPPPHAARTLEATAAKRN